MIRQIVYLDTYAVLNFFLDYFLLLGTGYATRAVLQRMRIVLSATIGAGYSIISLPRLVGEWSTVYLSTPLFFIMCAALLILISFGGRFFFRRLCIFLLFSSALGGFFYLFSGYIRLNLPVFLLMGAFFTVVLRKGFSGTFGKSPPVTKIKLFFNGCYTSFQALCDTGNQLLDPLTGRPVLIVEWNSISSLFPSEIKNHITCRSFKSPEEILTYFNQFFPGSFFLIPFQCVGSEHGLLLAFRSERILSDKKRVPVTVAITGTTLGTDCEYSALTSMEA